MAAFKVSDLLVELKAMCRRGFTVFPVETWLF